MRFMVIVKANKESERGALPDEKLVKQMAELREACADSPGAKR